MDIRIPSLASLTAAAEEFLPLLDHHRLFAFYGGMGSGKTTFIKALCERLGVTDSVASPTFAIVNEYALPQAGHSIFHFDFYRINSLREVYDIGFEDYFYGSSPCFIEWPELVEPLLPPEVVRVHVEVADDDVRLLHIELPA